MATNVDLTAAPAATGKSVAKTMVAIFKEEADTPRVLGESDAFIAYTLKNRRAIRLICRTSNDRGAFRLHESAVHDLRFVNFHSNVAASASQTDFFVWVAVHETSPDGTPDKKADPSTRLTVKPYFKLVDKVVLHRFHFFINPSNNMPDLLILYNKTAAVLQSSKLISEYTTRMLEAKLSEQSRELRQLPQETSSKSLCTTFSGGWFAFTSEATKVMACTLRNTTTPAWSGCEGEEIVQLSFIGSNAATDSAAAAAAAAAANATANSSSALLAICSTAKVYLWKLTGVAEPVLLRTFTFGSIVTMLSSRNAFAVFNDAGKVARVQMRDEASMEAVVYTMGKKVRPTSVCYHEAAHFATVLVDNVMDLNLYQLATNSNTSTSAGESKDKTAATAAAVPAAAPAVTTSAVGTPFVDPSIITTGIPFRPNLNSNANANKTPDAAVSSSSSPAAASANNNATSSAAMNANPMATMAAYQSARVALHNSSLPQSLDGLVASAVYQSDESVRRVIEGLLNVLKNITQILQLTPDQLLRDHQQLISLALEAQMTELQQGAALASTAAATTGSAANARHSEAFNSYALAQLLAPVASEIAVGVTRGVRDTLRTELDAAVNAAFGANVHKSQKEVLRRRLDEALQNSARVLSEDVASRVDRYIEQELSESLARVNASMSALEEQNRRLQSALHQIVNSGALQEAEAMRAELAHLREAIQRGEAMMGGSAAAGGAAPVSQSPQTVIETSEKYIKEGHIAQGLSYVTMAQNARCVVQLLTRLSEDDMADVVSDTETTESTWAKLIAQLCEPEAADTAAELETVALFLFDMLSDHDELISKKTARAQQMRSDVRHLIARARGKVDSSEGRRVLKDLEKCIQ
ncbi:immunodominant antigen tc40 antigen-like protein [Leptomonas seymouri]|uniref:Immunodominant antigen tc40 antigen-like protein n=1 Tax=Leptomonas seymouri TaxID=5684 RepID=A0A0N0P333_LEPSE|nr:immunodominant antigen tc40 antigen-like protein [Leptomonas seymouri]|eukprot:KPI83666.1 immunodominant antigen tc40 antigen-like protein [Leptomonas seymouri]